MPRTTRRAGSTGAAAPRRIPDLVRFVRFLIALRRQHDAFRRRRFLTGTTVAGTSLKDVYWLAPEGREMTGEDWGDDTRRAIGMQIGNDAADGRRFLVLLNGAPEDVAFRLASDFPSPAWHLVLDTAQPFGRNAEGETLRPRRHRRGRRAGPLDLRLPRLRAGRGG